MSRSVLIIGGGPAGVSAAKALVDRSEGIVLVERSESLGGMARELTCKGVSECRNCGACYVVDRSTELLRDQSAEVLLLSETTQVKKNGNGYEVKIKISPRYVTNNCIGCNKCIEACPVDDKAIFAPTGNGQPRHHWIDRSKCLHFKKDKCQKCADVCPTKAIDYEDRARNVTRKVSSIICATGMEPVDASEVKRLGGGVLENAISSLDAERILNKHGRLLRPSDGKQPKKVAVIQCVGSRSMKTGVEYCSKFCCKYATKISQLLIDQDPEVNLDFYFMDLRTLYEPHDDFKRWVKERKKTVRMIRSMPAVVLPGNDGNLVVRAATETDSEVIETEYDLVLLSVGMRPAGNSKELMDALGIKADERGFAICDKSLEDSGVFLVGTTCEPMDIEETSVKAAAAASRASHRKEGA
ncbi:MAG: FAD-dependent oxidoreductase [Candidatus Thermoplasmatota archaeon]|nr:FAD-dependent oxidoreductase [Candidatus Thermoplasmatota archaeon]